MEEVVEDSTWTLKGMVSEGVEDNISLSCVDIRMTVLNSLIESGKETAEIRLVNTVNRKKNLETVSAVVTYRVKLISDWGVWEI